jgi:hypothetical protein
MDSANFGKQWLAQNNLEERKLCWFSLIINDGEIAPQFIFLWKMMLDVTQGPYNRNTIGEETCKGRQ